MLRIHDWVREYSAKTYITDEHPPCRVDCSLGRNAEPLPPALMEALHAVTEEDIRAYPRGDGFLEALAERHSSGQALSPANFAYCCGSDTGLFHVNRLLLRPGAVALGYAPQFSAYVDDVRLSGAAYVPFLLDAAANYRLDADAFADFIRRFPKQVSAVYLDNPNNPTGQTLQRLEVERIARAALERDAALIVDEAYGEYMPHAQSALSLIGRYDNVFVLKTMSKGYGLAGIRMGYAASSDANMMQYRKVCPQYVGNSVARRLGAAALSLGEGYLEELMAGTRAKNRRLYPALERAGIRVAHTDMSTPIALLYTDDAGTDLCRLFDEAGVAVVSGAAFETLGKNAVRIMAPAQADMPLLLELIEGMGPPSSGRRTTGGCS